MSECPYQDKYKHIPWMKAFYVDIFCTGCWRHERFFTGGGSWSPDLCDCGCEDTTVWYKMGVLQRRKAKKKYKEDYEVHKKRLHKLTKP